MNKTLIEIFEKQATATAEDGIQWVDASAIRPDIGRRVMVVTTDGYTAVDNYHYMEPWTLCKKPVLYWTPVNVDGLPGVKPEAWLHSEMEVPEC